MPRVRKRVKRSSLRHYRWVIVLAVSLIFLLVGGSVLSFLTRYEWVRDAATPAPAQEEGPAPAQAAPPATGQAVARAYLEQFGEKKNEEKLLSVRVLGKLTVGDRVYDFEMHKRHPNLVRLQISDGRGRLMLGTDGDQAWMVRRLPDGRAQGWELDSAVADWLWLQGPPGTWLLHPNDVGPELVLEPTAPGAAGPEARLPVSVRSPTGREVRYFVDPAQFMPRRLELRDVDATTALWTAELEDARVDQGVNVPRRVVARRPGAPEVKLEIERIQFNPGTLQQVFRKPTVDETFALPARRGGPGAIVLPPPGTVAPAVTPSYSTGGQRAPASAEAIQRDMQSAFSGQGMMVRGGTAETSLFVPSPETLTAPPPLDGSSQTLLEQYGFPWPLPW